MQISSRIHIRVKDEKLWEKLKQIDLDGYGFPSTDEDGVFCNIKGKDFIVDSMWSYDTNKLVDLVRLLSGLFGKDCVIAADSTNLSGDANLYIICYCGGNVKTKLLFRNDYVDIIDLKKWFTYFTGKCALTKTEKEFLKKFDVDILTENKKKTAGTSKDAPDYEKYIVYDKPYLIPEVTKDTKRLGRFCIIADNDEHFAAIADTIKNEFSGKNADIRTDLELRMIYCVCVKTAGNKESYCFKSNIMERLFKGKFNDFFIGITDNFEICWYNDTYYSEEGKAYYYFGDRKKCKDEFRSWDCFTFDESFSTKSKKNAQINITDIKSFISAYFKMSSLSADEIAFVKKIMGGSEIGNSKAPALEGLNFVVTGDLENFPESGPYPKRTKLKALIEKNGGKLTGSISGKTSYLICNDVNSGTSKIAEARSRGVKIISEEEFMNMLKK